MREYPWTLREPDWGHLERYRIIRRRVLLTRAWVEGLGLPLSYLQRKGITPELERSQVALRHIESPSGEQFPEVLLGARTPQEFLDDLASAARIQQGLVVDQILKKDSNAQVMLRQISSESGRQAALEARASEKTEPGPVPSVRRAFLMVCRDGLQSILPERVTDGSVSWVDLQCPHQDVLLEVGPVMDKLCELQSAWREGFCKGWDSRIEFKRLRPAQKGGHCRFVIQLEGRAQGVSLGADLPR